MPSAEALDKDIRCDVAIIGSGITGALAAWHLTREGIPKPSIMLKLRGKARSDMTHINMCVLSGVSETKAKGKIHPSSATGNSTWALVSWQQAHACNALANG